MLCQLGWREHKVALPSGISLTVNIADSGVGFPLWAQKNYEPEETEQLRQVLKPTNIFVDIGANLGYYTTFAAKQVGAGGRVIAFEPSPYNYSLLERNVHANNFTNVTTLNMALGNHSGTVELSMSDSNYGDNRISVGGSDSAGMTTEKVKIGTLDEILKSLDIDRIDCIKMDVQGFEGYVCEGMVETLARANVTVFTEFWPNGIRATGKDPIEFLELFRRLGYVVRLFKGDGFETVAYDKVFDYIPKTGVMDTEYLNLMLSR